MSLRLQIIIILCLILAGTYIVNQLRKKRLDYRFGLGWILILFCLLIFTIFPQILSLFTRILGVYLPINMLVFFGFCFAAMLLFSMSMTISSLSDRVKKLSQEIAIIRKDMYDNYRKLSSEETRED